MSSEKCPLSDALNTLLCMVAHLLAGAIKLCVDPSDSAASTCRTA